MRYQTSPYSSSNRPRSCVQQPHQLLASALPCCSGRPAAAYRSRRSNGEGGVSSHVQARLNPHELWLHHAGWHSCWLDRCERWHCHSQKDAASSTVEVHTSPSRSRGVSATIAYSSTARAHCESTLQRDAHYVWRRRHSAAGTARILRVNEIRNCPGRQHKTARWPPERLLGAALGAAAPQRAFGAAALVIRATRS